MTSDHESAVSPWSKPHFIKQVHDSWAVLGRMHLDLPSFLELSARPLTLGQEESLPRMLGSQADAVRNGELDSLFHGFPEGA